MPDYVCPVRLPLRVQQRALAQAGCSDIPRGLSFLKFCPTDRDMHKSIVSLRKHIPQMFKQDRPRGR